MAADLYEKIASAAPKIERGKVWCIACGRMQRVDGAGALRNGWPKCCGATMTIDSPQWRRAHRSDADPDDRTDRGKNQCDGCMQGAEMRGTLHVDRYGKAFMVCERHKYAAPPQQSPAATPERKEGGNHG